MSIDEFWRLVADSKAAIDPHNREGNQDRQTAALKATLEAIAPKEIVAFGDHLWGAMIDAYRWDLWAAAYLLAEGCSDDGFLDFRSGLVSMGRGVYEAALREPDSLSAMRDDPSLEAIRFEGFQYVPTQVYEAVTGEEKPASRRRHPNSPAGVRWRDDADLQRLLPKTWARTKGR